MVCFFIEKNGLNSLKFSIRYDIFKLRKENKLVQNSQRGIHDN